MGQASNGSSGRFPELCSPGALQNHAHPRLGPASASAPASWRACSPCDLYAPGRGVSVWSVGPPRQDRLVASIRQGASPMVDKMGAQAHLDTGTAADRRKQGC